MAAFSPQLRDLRAFNPPGFPFNTHSLCRLVKTHRMTQDTKRVKHHVNVPKG